MNRRVVAVLVALSLWPWVQGHPADGSWRAEFSDPDGARRSVTFRLRVAGENLQGTVLLGRQSVPIEEGRVEGESLSFRVTLAVGEMELRIFYRGRVSGDALHLVQETRGGTRELVARRVG